MKILYVVYLIFMFNLGVYEFCLIVHTILFLKAVAVCWHLVVIGLPTIFWLQLHLNPFPVNIKDVQACEVVGCSIWKAVLV